MRPEHLVLLLTLTGLPAFATTPITAPTEPGDNTRAREPEASPELLEFLGSWETATGPWSETVPDSKTPAARRPKETNHD